MGCGVLATGLSFVLLAAQPPSDPPVVYRGMSDASAAVALDGEHFIVADDEHNTFHVYRRNEPNEPAACKPWDEPLRIDPSDEHPEADIEGAAWLDGRIYWITSHGRNKDGKWRPNRHRFFAITFRVPGEPATDDTAPADGCEPNATSPEATGAGRAAPGGSSAHGPTPSIQPFGRAYDRLARDLEGDPRLAALGVDRAIRSDQKNAERLAPKDEGLNIEGLAAGADGRSLLLGLRNPRPGGQALVVPLLNPREMLVEGANARLGEPILLDLRVRRRGVVLSLGVRSMEYDPAARSYLLVAGPADEQRVFALFRWSGDPADRPRFLLDPTAAIARFERFAPEAAFLWPTPAPAWQLLSDDGSLLVRVASPDECLPGSWENGTCEQKALRDARRRGFQSWSLGAW